VSASRKERSAEVAFSIFVVAGLFLFFASIVELIVALGERRKKSAGWKPLFLLAIGDCALSILVTAGVASVAIRGGGVHRVIERTDVPSAKIGVMAGDVEEIGEGARIGLVLPDSPAARAGLLAGDVIVSAGGARIADFGSLKASIAATTPSTSIALEVVRGGEQRTLSVIPGEVPDAPANLATVARRHAAGKPRELFEPSGRCPRIDRSPSQRMGWAIVGLIAGALAIVARIRGRPSIASAWGAVFVALTAGDALAVAGFLGACVELGGLTSGGIVLTIAFAVLWRLAVAWLALRSNPHEARARDDGDPGLLSAPQAFARGVLYLVGFMVRLALVVFAFRAITGVELGSPTNIAATVANEGWPFVARALIAVIIAIVGPVAEEILFRGILLPAIADRIGAVRAAIGTSAVFAVAHLTTHGPWIAVAFIYALVLSWARIRTGGLKASIALHVLINASAITAALIRAR
jgi:membrane protease YdiL (CAAX protease family)